MRLGLLLLVSVLYCAKAQSQTVVVTDDGTYTTGNTSSVLDVKSISKGFLMPRMTSAQRTAITSPATGLLVYQTDGTTGFYHYDGSTWKILSTTGNTIGVTNGGTGLTSATLGDIHYASAANTISNLAGNITASKRFLTQTGTGTVSAAPGWNAIVATDIPDISATYSPRAGSTALVTLGTVATGTWNATAIGVTKGGTGLTAATLGDLRYGSAANTLAALAGNTTTTKKFLTQTGTGTVSAAPGWNTLTSTDIPDLSATYAPVAGSASIATVGTVNTGTWNATTIGTTKGGTGLTSYTIGDMPYASAANTLSNLAGNATTTKKFLTQTGTGSASAAPVWNVLSSTDISDLNTNFSPIGGSTSITTVGTVTTGAWTATPIDVAYGGSGLTSIGLGDLRYGSTSNTMGNLAGNTSTTKKILTQTGTGSASAAPAWGTLTSTDIPDIATLYSPIAGAASITTVGTVTTGTWNATTIAPTKGGTGLTSYTLGDIPYASAANTLSTVPGNTTTTKKYLNQTGTGTASDVPEWDPIVVADIADITTSYSPLAGSTSISTVGTVNTGTWNATAISVTKGGTGLTTTALGNIYYGSAANTVANLTGNITTTKKFLTQTGTGTVSAAPGWNTLVAADVPDISATYSPRAGSTSLVTLGTIATGTWNATTIGVTKGGTGLTTVGLGEISYGSAANVMANLAANTTATKKFLTQTGTGTAGAAPVWNVLSSADISDLNANFSPIAGSTSITTVGTVTTGTWSATTIATTKGGTGLTSYTLGDIPYASAANTLSNLAGNITTGKKVLTQTGTGSASAAPAWGTLSSTDIPDIATTYSPIAGSASITTVGTITSGTWNGTAIGPTKGGTGLTSYTLGDIPYASAANTLSNLPGNITTTKKYLNQTGTGSASDVPEWDPIVVADIADISTSYSPLAGSTSINTVGTVNTGTWNATTIGVTKGGTGLTTTALGDLYYGSAANVLSNLVGNTTATKKFLTQTGTGTVSAAPGWNTLVAADIPDISATYSPRAGSTALTTTGTITTGVWSATDVSVSAGGTGNSSATAYALQAGGTTTTNPHQSLATGTSGQILKSGGATALPTWGSLVAGDIPDISATYSPRAGSTALTTLGTIATGTWNGTTIATTKGGTGLTSYAIGDLPYASAANTLSNLAGNITTAKKILTQTGTGTVSAAPTWDDLSVSDISDIATSYAPVAGSTSVTTLGTVTTGTWSATTIGVTKGGTGLTTVALGEVSYGSAANVMANLPGNTTTTKKFLTQTGTGTVSAAPGWNTLVAADIPDVSATYSPRAGSTALTTAGTITTGVWSATDVSVSAGGTGNSSATAYALQAGGTTTTGAHQSLTTGTSGQVLKSGGAAALPTWNTLSSTDVGLGNVENTAISTWAGSSNITTVGTVATGTWNASTIGVTKGGTGLTTVGLGEVGYGSAANVMANLPGNTTTTKKFLTQTGTGSVSAAPGWNTLAVADIPTGIDAANIGTGSVSSTEFGYLSTTTSDVQTQINNKEAKWDIYQVSGTNATNATATLADITGMVTSALAVNTSYEFEAVLNCGVAAATTGTKYAVNVTVAPTIIVASYTGSVTSTTGGVTTTTANNTADATTFMTTSAQNGIIIIKGIVTTAATGSPVLSIKHQVGATTNTSTVRIGSILRIRKL